MAAGLIAGAILYQVVGRRSPGTATQPPARTPRTVETAPVQRAARSDVPPVAPVEPMPPAVPAIEKPSPFIPKTRPSAKPAAPIKPPATPQTAARSQPPPTPTGSASRTETPASTAVVIHGNADPGPAAAPPAPPPPAVLAPITTPARIEQPRRPARHATVTVEPVSGSKIGRVVGRIPVFGRLGRKNNKDFVPARPIRQITPAVPAGEQLEHDVPVDVKVTVDPSGNVASVDTRGGDKELARVAADAARNWQFIPARRNDESVSSELILHFTFKSPASAQP